METRAPRTQELLGPPQQPTSTREIENEDRSKWPTLVRTHTIQEEILR